MHGILLWPLGGLAFVGHAGSPARDLYVAVCGPLTHIPQVLQTMFVHMTWAHFTLHNVSQAGPLLCVKSQALPALRPSHVIETDSLSGNFCQAVVRK